MVTLGLVLDRSFERMDGRGRHKASAHRPRMNLEKLDNWIAGFRGHLPATSFKKTRRGR